MKLDPIDNDRLITFIHKIAQDNIPENYQQVIVSTKELDEAFRPIVSQFLIDTICGGEFGFIIVSAIITGFQLGRVFELGEIEKRELERMQGENHPNS